MKIGGCAGHGLFTPGKATPDGEHEWSFNNKVILAFEEALKQYEGTEFKRFDDRTGKTDVPLKTRTDGANEWGADLYISFHHNADKGVWGTHTGTETYTYLGSNPKSEKLAALVQPKIVKAYGLFNRGCKKANYHICRETHMPAVLIEGGYMDSTIDIKKLSDDSVLKVTGYAVAEAVAEYGNLKKKVIVQPKMVGSISLDTIPEKRPDKYRLASFIDTDVPATIEDLKKRGYKVIALPEGK